MKSPRTIDWSVLSGPKVSRRTLLEVAAASGATAYATRLIGASAASSSRQDSTRTLAQEEPKQGGELRWGFGLGQIPTLDPGQVTLGIVAGELLSNLFSGLVQFDEQLGIIADLAETWDVSEDGLQYTFHLREGLTFHNGDSLTAEDFVYTYERNSDPDFASPQANKLAIISDIVATDDVTLDITLSEPSAPFLATTASRGPGRALTPVSRGAIEEMGDDEYGLAPVGCGPFMIVPETVEVGGGFEMVAFDGWYGGRPHLDKVIVQLVAEASTLVSALEANDVDAVDILPLIGFEQISAYEEIEMVEAAGTNWYGISISYNPPWDNLDARLAIAKAVDREDLISKAFFGRSTRAVGPIAPAFDWAYLPPEEVEDAQAFDLDEARSLAESSGIQGSQPIFITGTPNDRVVETIRNQLTEIGVEAQIEQMQTNAYVERRNVGDYDFSILGSVVDTDPDDGIWNFFHSTGPSNPVAYSNPEMDELVDAQRTAANEEERIELLHQIQQLANQEVPFVFLFHSPDVTAFYNYVKGYVNVPEQRYLEHIWLDQ